MSYFSIDVEADGPIPGDYSMVTFGAVLIAGDLTTTFYGKLKPISDIWVPDALKVSGFSRAKTLTFNDPAEVMLEFETWVLANSTKRAFFFSDNNGFDWSFINWYFHHFIGRNPFGHSSTNIGSLYKGATRNMRANFKHLRKTKHSHNAVDDAKGNAEALISFDTTYNLKALK